MGYYAAKDFFEDDKLVEFVPGPDFPTGGVIVEPRESILEAYKTGRGGFRLRARWEKEDTGRGGYQICDLRAAALTRRGGRFWQQLKGRFRRDGKADRIGDVRDEESPDTPAPDEGEPRKRD